jgi:hypothetical protein
LLGEREWQKRLAWRPGQVRRPPHPIHTETNASLAQSSPPANQDRVIEAAMVSRDKRGWKRILGKLPDQSRGGGVAASLTLYRSSRRHHYNLALSTNKPSCPSLSRAQFVALPWRPANRPMNSSSSLAACGAETTMLTQSHVQRRQTRACDSARADCRPRFCKNWPLF